MIAKALQARLAQEQIKTIYIEPASPRQNGFVESFHGRFRDECLNRKRLWTLTEGRERMKIGVFTPAAAEPEIRAAPAARPIFRI